MTSHVALDRDAHRDLRIRGGSSAELGDGVMACLTVPDEFRRVQNEFPILFRRDLDSGLFSALALFGFENGENLFIEDGRWDARYRPLALAIQALSERVLVLRRSLRRNRRSTIESASLADPSRSTASRSCWVRRRTGPSICEPGTSGPPPSERWT